MCRARPGIWSVGMTVKFTYSIKCGNPSTSLPISNCHSVFLVSFMVFQMYHPSLNPIFSLLYSWNFLLAFVLSITLKCPMDKYQCLFLVLVLLDLYFTLLSLPCNSGILFFGLWDPFWSFSSQFLAFPYWSFFSSPQKITFMSWLFQYFFCIHFYLFWLFTLTVFQ